MSYPQVSWLVGGLVIIAGCSSIVILTLCGSLGQVTGENEALTCEVRIALGEFGIKGNKLCIIGCLWLTTFGFFLKRYVWDIQLNSRHPVKVGKPYSNIYDSLQIQVW